MNKQRTIVDETTKLITSFLLFFFCYFFGDKNAIAIKSVTKTKYLQLLGIFYFHSHIWTMIYEFVNYYANGLRRAESFTTRICALCRCLTISNVCFNGQFQIYWLHFTLQMECKLFLFVVVNFFLFLLRSRIFDVLQGIEHRCFF